MCKFRFLSYSSGRRTNSSKQLSPVELNQKATRKKAMMVHSQTPNPSTLPAESSLVYAEPQLTERAVGTIRFLCAEGCPP